MPSFLRPKVTFTPAPVYSRLPRDDEAYVMRLFARHCAHCPSCANPYEVHRSGRTLCDKGHKRALDVAEYVYSKGGKAYSAVDSQGNRNVQIEIPADCEAVRSLLKAMDRGLRIMRREPLVSYDKNYYVPPRPTIIHAEPRYLRKPRLETEVPPPVKRPRFPIEITYGPRVSYQNRGSLYGDEIRERAKYSKPTVYYRVSPQIPPQVPPKDIYHW